MSPMTEQLPKVKHEEVAEFILRVHGKIFKNFKILREFKRFS